VNVTEIIDQVLGRDDNVAEDGADNLERRTRHLEYLREVQSEVWWTSDWSTKKKRDTVTVPAGQGYVALPPDFQSIGVYGGIWFPIAGQGDGRKLEIRPESDITNLRESNYRTSVPRICALFGQDAFYRPLVQVALNDDPVTLAVWYQPQPPRIDEVVGFTPQTDIAMTAVSANTGVITTVGAVDFTTQFLNQKFVRVLGFANAENNGEFEINGTVTATNLPVYKTSGDDLTNEALGPSVTLQGHVNDIKAIPEQYHQILVVPGLRAKARESKGDQKWKIAMGQFQDGKKLMKMEEMRFQGEYRQLPSHFGR
jgi:hypothetical protein